ncbi:MAG: VWA domain-containing protein, partial [Acidobacteriota bacterium]
MPPRASLCRAVLPALAAVAFLSAVFIVSPPAAEVRGAAIQTKTQSGERKKPVKPELDTRGAPQEDQKQYRIGVRVDLVVVYASVTDKNGHFVSGLTKENFSVFEDGVQQEITAFSQEDVPLSVGFVLDTSGSMRNKFNTVTRAALAFIRASNTQDQVFLIGFNDEVELIEDFTNDVDLIADSLENTIVTGGTALYDAIYLGVQKAGSGAHQKKAIVVFSDGEDRDSYYKLEELVAKVQESDVQIYSIGFLNPVPEKGLFGRWSKSVPEKAHDALQQISDETGARAFFPKDLSEICAMVGEVAHELRNQYGIGYVSMNTAQDGSWRRIRIMLNKDAPAGSQVRH